MPSPVDAMKSIIMPPSSESTSKMDVKKLDDISLAPLQADPSYFLSMEFGEMLFTRSSSSCVDVFIFLFGSMAEADLRQSAGKCSKDVVSYLAIGETKFILLRAWKTTIEAECRAQSKCTYRLIFSNTSWNDLFSVPVLDFLRESDVACGIVNKVAILKVF
jgi:hypothetical protein